ncbi:MAG: DJ-1/PfpI family protein [Alphaproteobacteria bacterium]|nr:DJ-1/PfpI family protein [Alphaproteobacteria bacterium]MBU1513440.1 DJ-1/PfpI family protein [Alphaproteobacteria bacterium]MBU2096432.1 DJ-1/PfpI family protein [Alphaproteobacteria bacterium]MBU2149876.1 DJ-1/PfpI family protein [Alphaproteobacteria bacterium]MBU2308218.1 DJ-1/PfpI family protein [Alphaproteobacteria bacterium]
MPKLQIVFVLYPGVTHLDFTGPHQVLVRTPNAEVVVASMGGQDIEAEGLVFTKLADLAKIARCDVLCVPGGFGTTDAMLDDAFMAEVRRLGADATYVTSVCTGSLILGAAGFLQGREAATHWAWRELLPSFGATVSEARVARDGRVITGGGVTAGIDFALVLLEELAGRDYAEAVQLGLEYAPAPPFNAGRPELARPEVLALVKARMAAAVDSRAEAAAQAAERMAPA